MLGVLTSALVFLAANQATDKNELTVVYNVPADPDKCNAPLATKVELQSLAIEPGKWTGKCIAVDGYWKHRALFATGNDARTRYAQVLRKLSDRRVGVYLSKELQSAAPKSAVAYTVVGIAGRSETLWEGAVFVSGYCHYADGPFIAVTETLRR
jgi:hypothetical protein